MSFYTFQLTHLKPTTEVYASEFKKETLPDGKKQLARAVDSFLNIYYCLVLVFANGNGAAVIHDPQLKRTCVQVLPSIELFLQEGFLIARHPPLCRNCWVDEPEIISITNHFRINLQYEQKLPSKKPEETISPELELIYETVAMDDIFKGLVPPADSRFDHDQLGGMN